MFIIQIDVICLKFDLGYSRCHIPTQLLSRSTMIRTSSFGGSSTLPVKCDKKAVESKRTSSTFSGDSYIACPKCKTPCPIIPDKGMTLFLIAIKTL